MSRISQTALRFIPNRPNGPDSRMVTLAVSVVLLAQVGGCAFIDSFSDFHAKKPGTGASDGGAGDGAAAQDASMSSDAALPDAGVDAGPKPACQGDADCSKLDDDCTKGTCTAGKCVAAPTREGKVCASASKCTVNAVCKKGVCKGAAKSCTSLDSDCTKGVCDNATGNCKSTNINEQTTCFDNDPCTVDEVCDSGVCVGTPKDCSAISGSCAMGVCSPNTGNCIYAYETPGTTCPSSNPCALSAVCNATGDCVQDPNSAAAPPTTQCDDFNPCTGTGVGITFDPTMDNCDGAGTCTRGPNSASTATPCSDDNECTGPDACDGTGTCVGSSTREGLACDVDCRAASTCQSGLCLDANGYRTGYSPQCYFNWCDQGSLCDPAWDGDGVCDCGCGFADSDCGACSPRMCETRPTLSHEARDWCDSSGNAVNDCPDILKGDGKCDCGCQFDDPDCSGGDCCTDRQGATDPTGCSDLFVQECVCSHSTNADPSCCDRDPNASGYWDAICALEAVQLGCAICP